MPLTPRLPGKKPRRWLRHERGLPQRPAPGWRYGRAAARAAFGVTTGWASQISAAYRNDWIAVLVRSVHSDLLDVMVDHAAIRTAMCAEFGWRELQRIKDEIFGKDRMAVQVYPRQVELVDAADMYHLWVFPIGYSFDFGLGTGQR